MTERDGQAPDDELAGALDELRGAWRALPAPPPARELRDEDAPTRRAVEWTRSAWLALPVPAAAPPARTILRAPSWRERRLWRAAAVAAALLLAASLPLLALALRRRPDATPPTPVAEHAAPPHEALVVAAHDGHLELRSGPVRLYLIPDPIRPSNETSQ
jgi:hypothetical protein